MEILYALILVPIFCPALPGIYLLWDYSRDGKVGNKNAWNVALAAQIFSVLLSPGLLVIYWLAVRNCGTGCASGVWLIFVLPIAWIAAIVGYIQGALSLVRSNSGNERKHRERG